jgi:hypothetical protein
MTDIELFEDKRFCSESNHTYPPFKNGLYLEEYFMLFMKQIKPKVGMNYIPALFTNFQTQKWFGNNHISSMSNYLKTNMSKLSHYDENRPNFCVCQHDEGPQIIVPPNTIIFSSSYPEMCKLNSNATYVTIPLIYEDKLNRLENVGRIKYKDKKYLCSFVGTITKSYNSNVRVVMMQRLKNNKNFYFKTEDVWTINVAENRITDFIEITKYSKFALAPRGYGKTSFRFYESLLMGVIPIYIWDDIEWLPYKNHIDYSKFSISINIKDIDKLESMLLNIDETKYNNMLNEYYKVSKLFTLQGVSEYIVGVTNLEQFK